MWLLENFKVHMCVILTFIIKYGDNNNTFVIGHDLTKCQRHIKKRNSYHHLWEKALVLNLGSIPRLPGKV